MRNLKKLVLVGGVSTVMAVTGLTGCSWFHNESSERTVGRAIDDKVIKEEVEERLQDEPVYKFSDVDVKTFGGVVQLSGFVNSEEQKRRAGQIAQRVEGVQQVINNITLKQNLSPTGRNGTNDANIQIQSEQPRQPNDQ